MIDYKIMRGIVHQCQQLPAFVDDSSSLTPGECSCKKAGYLYILFFDISMWNGNRVVFDKARLIVNGNPLVQKRLKLLEVHQLLIVGNLRSEFSIYSSQSVKSRFRNFDNDLIVHTGGRQRTHHTYKYFPVVELVAHF